MCMDARVYVGHMCMDACMYVGGQSGKAEERSRGESPEAPGAGCRIQGAGCRGEPRGV